MTRTDPQVVGLSSPNGATDAVVIDDEGPGLLDALWRHKWSSVAITLVVVAVASGTGYLLAPGARATAVLALSTPPPGNMLAPSIQGEASLARYTEQRAGFVTSDAVLAAASRRIGGEDVASLRDKVSASASSTASTITVTVTADSRSDAVALADAVVQAYTDETTKEVSRLADAAVASIEENVREVEFGLLAGNATVTSASAEMLSQLRLQEMKVRRESELFGGGIEYVNAPSLDAVEEPGLPTRETGMGLVLGFVIAATVAWTRADRADRRRRAGRGG